MKHSFEPVLVSTWKRRNPPVELIYDISHRFYRFSEQHQARLAETASVNLQVVFGGAGSRWNTELAFSHREYSAIITSAFVTSGGKK